MYVFLQLIDDFSRCIIILYPRFRDAMIRKIKYDSRKCILLYFDCSKSNLYIWYWWWCWWGNQMSSCHSRLFPSSQSTFHKQQSFQCNIECVSNILHTCPNPKLVKKWVKRSQFPLPRCKYLFTRCSEGLGQVLGVTQVRRRKDTQHWVHSNILTLNNISMVPG